MLSHKLKLSKLTFILLSVLGLSINVPTEAGHNSTPSAGNCYHYHVNDWGLRVIDSYLGPKHAFYSCVELYMSQIVHEHETGEVVSESGQKAFHSQYQQHQKTRPDDPNCVIDTYDPMEPNY